jgi:hypothetical protein
MAAPCSLHKNLGRATDMKIWSTSNVEPAALRRTQRRSDKSGETFHVDSPGSARSSAPLTQSAPLTAVDTLLALQAVPEASEGRRRAVRRAGDMLDLLDEIRVGLLEGTVPEGKLKGLLRVVQSRREAVADPRLSAVLDEIELRAEVELAKYGASLGNR